VVLYNIPGRSGVPINVETIVRLVANPMIQAVKEAAGSVDRVSEILEKVDTAVLCGDDSLTVPMISVGAKGVISVASNLIPGELSAMVDAALAGDFAAALRLHRKYYRVFKDLFIETNPIPIKAAMAMVGQCTEEYRLPLCEMAPANREKLAAALKSCGIL
jgi:4-hydroxy-tetrahydrodipicolinate synthase